MNNSFLPPRIKPGFNRFSVARDALDQSFDNNSASPILEDEDDNEELSKTPQSPNKFFSGTDDTINQSSAKKSIGDDAETPKARAETFSNENNKSTLPSAKKFEEFKLIDDEEVFRGKIKEPFIKTFVKSLTEIGSEDVGLKNWSELQELLKSTLSFAKNEMENKENLMKTLKEHVQNYSQLQLIIREKNEMITFKKVTDEMKKTVCENPVEVLGNATPYVKDFLYTIYNNPKIIAVLSRNKENLKGLEETLTLAFYEDHLADDDGDYEVIRLFAEVLQFELNNIQKSPDQAKQEGLNKIMSTNLDGYFNKLWTVYLKKTECKAYVRTILRNPLLAFLRERPRMKFDPKEVKKDLEKRKQKQQKNAESKQKSASKDKDKEKETPSAKASTLEDTTKTGQEGSPSYIAPREEGDRIPAPKFKLKPTKAQENGKGIEESKMKEFNKSFEMVDDQHESPLSRIEDKEVVASILKKFRSLKRHLTTLIQSIFDSLEHMPMGLRILCRLIYSTMKNKFPDLDEKEYNKILYNYLFTKWVVPHYCLPGKTDVLEDFELSDDMFNSLTFIAKVLKEIFNCNTYQPEDIMSELNEYIHDTSPSILNYFKELIAINEESLNDIIQNNHRSSSLLKSRSICISLNEIKFLCKSIAKQKDDFSGSLVKMVNLAEMILHYDQNEGTLSVGLDKETGLPLLGAPQTFVLFTDIMLPQQAEIDYLEEFKRSPAIQKDLPESEKIVLKTKSSLINLFINVKDIRNISKWSSETDLNLDYIISKFAEKPFYIDIKSSTKTDKTPYISAKFLVTLLNQLPDDYKSNNYFKLYQEIAEDLKKLTENIHSNISSTKFQLLDAIDTIKAKFEYLREIVDERTLTFKRMKIRQIIKGLKIPLCISSPSTLDRYVNESAKSGNKKSNAGWDSEKKIEIKLRADQGCIHQKFSMMKELSLSAGAIALGPMKQKSFNQSMLISSTGNSSKAKQMIEDDDPAHVGTVDKFIAYFGSLSEVRQTIQLGKDLYGTNDALVSFYHLLAEEILFLNKDIPEEEYKLVEDEIENYICKQLYYLTVPLQEQEFDKKFWKICKTHDWVNYDHLEIIPRNRQTEMWEYAAKMLNQMDNEITPLEKLDCIMECFKTITLVLDLAAGKEGSGGADDTLPIMIYVVLKACPRRIQVNSNFIEYFRDKNKMQAEKGYCFIQLQSAIMSILHIEPEFLRMDKKEYEEAVQKKEMELRLIGKIK